jgi:hypothetical protein
MSLPQRNFSAYCNSCESCQAGKPNYDRNSLSYLENEEGEVARNSSEVAKISSEKEKESGLMDSAALQDFAKNATEEYKRALAAKTAAEAFQQALAATAALKSKHAEENAVVAREQAEAERLMDAVVKEAALRLEFEAWIGKQKQAPLSELPKGSAGTGGGPASPPLKLTPEQIKDQNFLTAGYHIGLDTSILRNSSHDIRPVPPNPIYNVGIWNQSTIDYSDVIRRPLE